MWGDVGRCGEIWGRCGEIWGSSRTFHVQSSRMASIRGTAARTAELERSACSQLDRPPSAARSCHASWGSTPTWLGLGLGLA